METAIDIFLHRRATVEKLIKLVPSVEPACRIHDVFERFHDDTKLLSIPVTRQGCPVGLISRHTIIEGFSQPYYRELNERKPCETIMDPNPLVVEKTVSIQDLSGLILQSEPHHLTAGFIITENGQYIGTGSGHDLLRLITEMQINAARYANPLTLLPGNVPINESIDALLEMGKPFVICYCDLDHFKPFNDVYGYQKGDEVIKLTGRLLTQACAEQDFLGHIGGDDFILLFRSEDWEQRCQTILDRMAEEIPKLYVEADLHRGGIETEDRHGVKHLHPIVSLSIGAAIIDPKQFGSHHEVSKVASMAKKQAKKIAGNNLFIERRTL